MFENAKNCFNFYGVTVLSQIGLHIYGPWVGPFLGIGCYGPLWGNWKHDYRLGKLLGFRIRPIG